MELQGEWMGGKDAGSRSRRRRKPTKDLPTASKSTSSSAGSSFLPELVDAINELNPHQEDAAASLSSHRRNAPSDSGNTLANPEADVWSAYAELQSAYSALQASELSASTHLQQSAGLLEKERKRASSLKEKLGRSTKARDAVKRQLAEVLSESKEISRAFENKKEELETERNRLQEVEATCTTETRARKEAEAAAVELRGRIKTYTKNAKDREDTLTAEIEALKSQLEKLEKDAKTANRDLGKSTKVCERLRAECASTESALVGLRAQCSTLEIEVAIVFNTFGPGINTFKIKNPRGDIILINCIFNSYIFFI